MIVRAKDWSFLKIYARFLWKTPWLVSGSLICLVLAQVFTFAQSFIGKYLFNAFSNKQAHEAFVFVVLFIVVRFLSKLFSRTWALLDRLILPRVFVDLDGYALGQALNQSYSFFTSTPSGAILTKLRQLPIAFERLLNSVPGWFSLFSNLLVTGVLLFSQGWIACLVASAYITSIAMIVFFTERIGKPLERAKSEQRAKAVGTEADILTQAITVLLFGAQKRENQGFRKRLQSYYAAWNLRTMHNRRVSTSLDALSLLFECSMLIILFLRWQAGLITVGDIVLYQSLIAGVIASMMQFDTQFRSFHDSTVEAEEAMHIIEATPDIQDKPHAKNLQIKQGEIRFDHVSFNYHLHPLLQDLTLTIRGRERIALVGRSGAGKSTIIKLLLRCHDPKSGQILIDGQAIQSVKQQSLREQISYVPQEPLLFHRTLKENIAYGKPNASSAEIVRAAKQAHCHEFISHLPQKYDTLVGERGVKLSGGERQRVAIARAILKDAPILLLDEATSSLDPESEQLIQAAIEQLVKQKTVIVIAHRLSTIRHMDRVIVIDQGKIVDEGTHAELIKTDSIYADFWMRQTQGA